MTFIFVYFKDVIPRYCLKRTLWGILKTLFSSGAPFFSFLWSFCGVPPSFLTCNLNSILSVVRLFQCVYRSSNIQYQCLYSQVYYTTFKRVCSGCVTPGDSIGSLWFLFLPSFHPWRAKLYLRFHNCYRI